MGAHGLRLVGDLLRANRSDAGRNPREDCGPPLSARYGVGEFTQMLVVGVVPVQNPLQHERFASGVTLLHMDPPDRVGFVPVGTQQVPRPVEHVDVQHPRFVPVVPEPEQPPGAVRLELTLQWVHAPTAATLPFESRHLAAALTDFAATFSCRTWANTAFRETFALVLALPVAVRRLSALFPGDRIGSSPSYEGRGECPCGESMIPGGDWPFCTHYQAHIAYIADAHSLAIPHAWVGLPGSSCGHPRTLRHGRCWL